MDLKQCAVFLPCLAGILAERILHWEEQFRRFVERVIRPIDAQQNHEKQKGTDTQPCRGWRTADGPDKHAEILPPPMNEARHRPRWMSMAGTSQTGAAATGHVCRVTKTDEFFLPEVKGWSTHQFYETLNV